MIGATRRPSIWCATCWVWPEWSVWRRRRRPLPSMARGTGIGPRGSRTWCGWCRSWALSWWSLGLAWWGREPSAGASNSSPRSSGPRVSELNVVAGPAAAGSSPSSVAGESGPEPANPAPAYPRNIPVSSNEDLLEILATAPRRSVIVLSDDGPYRLGGRTWSSRSPAPLANPDLVIKAEPGVRPLIKFADDASSTDHPLSSLLQFIGGHVTIEGLKFEMDAVLPEELVTAIRTEDTELTVRGCSFRRTNSREGRNVAAIQVRTIRPPAAAGDRPPAVLADSCHFDGGQTGILAEGPSMSSCAIARWGPDSHRSGLTTRGPMFRSSASCGSCTRASWPARLRSFASTAPRHASGSTTA